MDSYRKVSWRALRIPFHSLGHILVRVTDEPCLLCVHAHPDDESSKGAPTVAKYRSQGVRCVLVCCTGGEEGDILNPAMDRPEIRDHLAQVRADELARAAQVIGYDELFMLGYRDSGMPGTEANERADSFAKAPLDEAAGRLVAIIRRVKPQVMAIYPEHQSMYPHPDHIRVHEVGLAAFNSAGDPDAFGEAGPPWQPQKLYYMLWSKKRQVALAKKFRELGMEIPWGEERMELMAKAPQEEITTEIDTSEWAHVREDALRAHATQVDPSSPFWFGLPADVAAELGHFDEYHLARNLTTSEPPEDDLFAGIEQRASL
jgi:mycothiol S-conjugate amidase